MLKMPILDTQLSRLNKFVGKEFTIDELAEVLFRFGMELDSYEKLPNGDYALKIEITPDRPDMLSVFGLARALRKYLGINPGLEEYALHTDARYKILVDKSVTRIRPYIAGVVVHNIRLDEDTIRDLIYAQEKLHETFCRGRKKASIGLYPLKNISWPLHYYAEDPYKIRFKPLGFDFEMTAIEILQKHPTGQKYAHILLGHEKYPLFTDNANHVLSLPPIINSEDYGKITPEDNKILIETTGIHKPTVKLVINIMATIMHDLGGKLYSVEIVYPESGSERSPYLEYREVKIKTNYINEVLGIKLSCKKACELLARMGFGTKKISDDEVLVRIPPYRADIWHLIDIIDDIGRAYGFDNMEPELTPVFTVGGLTERSTIITFIRDLLIGLGFTEAFTFALTSIEDQFDKMLLERDENIVIIAGAREKKINMVRKWLLPELLKALANNKDRRYPIKLFEVSDVVVPDNRSDTGAINKTHLALVSAHKEANFTEARQCLEYVLQALGFENLSFIRTRHSSFIEGRVAKVIVDGKDIGVIGELHPQVILNWGLAVPISAAEISISELFGWKYKPVDVPEF